MEILRLFCRSLVAISSRSANGPRAKISTTWLAADNLRDMTCKKRGVLHTTNSVYPSGWPKASWRLWEGRGSCPYWLPHRGRSWRVIVPRRANWRRWKKGLLLEEVAQIASQSQQRVRVWGKVEAREKIWSDSNDAIRGGYQCRLPSRPDLIAVWKRCISSFDLIYNVWWL